jgi:hypothetical protein
MSAKSPRAVRTCSIRRVRWRARRLCADRAHVSPASRGNDSYGRAKTTARDGRALSSMAEPVTERNQGGSHWRREGRWVKDGDCSPHRQEGVFAGGVQPRTDDVPFGRRRAPDPRIGQVIEDGGGHRRDARQPRARCPLTGHPWQSGWAFGCTGGAADHWVHHRDEPARLEVGMYPGRASGARGRRRKQDAQHHGERRERDCLEAVPVS